MAAKDFGLIESDYEFFMSHATEAESDIAEYSHELERVSVGATPIRMLDFGCGTGDFTEQLLSKHGWRPQSLQLTLIEPVPHQREEAVRRLARFSGSPIQSLKTLPINQQSVFDLVLSNHVLYYVDDLATTLRQMCDLLAAEGKLLLAIAGMENSLIQLWKTGFEMLGKPIPYHVSEDVEAILLQQGARFRKSRAYYQLRFPDTVENRIRILRFLFGEYLQAMNAQRLSAEFDRYVCGDRIEVNTYSDHFTVEATISR